MMKTTKELRIITVDLLYLFTTLTSFLLFDFVSEQPHIPKQEHHHPQKAKPDPPADTGALGHEEHAVHGGAEAEAGALERVVHLLGQGGGVADLVADGEGYL